MAQLLEGS